MNTFRKLLPAGQFGTDHSTALLLEHFPEAKRHPTAKTPGVWEVDGGRVVTTCRGIVHITRNKTSPLAAPAAPQFVVEWSEPEYTPEVRTVGAEFFCEDNGFTPGDIASILAGDDFEEVGITVSMVRS